MIASLARQVRPEERPAVIDAFLLLFGFTCGHLLLETARDALFLARLPAHRLPWVYLAIAVLALALLKRAPVSEVSVADSRRSLIRGLRWASLITLGLWGAFPYGGVAAPYALYVWTGVLATLFVVRFWTGLATTFTVTRAKRVYAVIGAGAVAGGIVGAGLSAAIAAWSTARYLVVAAAVVFALTSLLPARGALDPSARPTKQDGTPPPPLHVAGQAVLRSPYLLRVGIVLLLGSITFTLVDYVFKSAVGQAVSPRALDSFFATTYLALNLLSLLVQLALAGWLVRRLGVNRAMAITPALIMLSGIGLAATGGLAMAVGLKAIDGGLRNSLHRTGAELLFVPIGLKIRAGVKPILDVVGQRGGQALASLLILVLLSADPPDTVFPLLAAGAAALWLGLSLELRRHYLDLFRESLNDEIAAARWELPVLEPGELDRVLRTMNPLESSRSIALLDLASAYRRDRLIPNDILESPSDAVVTRALEMFAATGRREASPHVLKLLDHPSSAVRAAAVRALAVLQPGHDLLERLRDDPSSAVRGAAVIASEAMRPDLDPAGLAALADRAGSGPTEERLELARGMRARPSPTWAVILPSMLMSREDEVRIEVIHAIGTARMFEASHDLVPLLADRTLRAAARAALLSIGTSVLPILDKKLADPRAPHDVRRQIPSAIAAFGTAPAAGLLVHRLGEEADGMIRFKILRSLGRMRRRQPLLPLDQRVLRRERLRAVWTASRFMSMRHAVAGGSGDVSVRSLLEGLLRDKQAHALERAFRLYNLESGSEDYFRCYRGLQSGSRDVRAGGRELLEHLLPIEELEAILRLVDDLDERDAAAGTGGIPDIGEGGLAAVLKDLQTGGSSSIRELAFAYEATLRVELPA